MVKSIQEQFFTINQASEKCGLPRSTLRFWERRFSPFLDPVRSTGGQRRYSDRHLRIIGRIIELKQQGLALGEVYRTLGRDPISAGDADTHTRLEELATRVAGIVKSEVYRFFAEEAERGQFETSANSDALHELR